MFPVRNIALFAIIAAQVNAFAQEKTDKDIQKTVVPYGLIQAYSNVADTQYASDPDFTTAVIRFGVKVTEGITRAQLETEYYGNVPETGNITPATVGLNGVGIRRADLGLALSSGTTVSLGRVRMGGADAWGVDATAAPEQFGWMDGASVVQRLSLGEKNELSFALGVGNSMGRPSGRDSHTFGRTLKSDRGVVVGARANYQGFVAAAYYGMEKNQVKQEAAAEQAVLASDGTPVGADGKPIGENGTPFGYVKLKKVTTARDASHFEGSLGYNQANYAFGGWYQSISLSDLRIAKFVDGKFDTSTIPTKDDEKFGAKPSPKVTDSTVGFGFNTDSSLVGYTDVLQKGALLTLGGSYAISMSRDGDSSNDSEEAKEDQTQYAIGLGYQASGFALELGQEVLTSKGPNFNDKNFEQGGKRSKENASRTYIVGIYSF